MSRRATTSLILISALGIAAGCGKPGGGPTGPQAEFPSPAVVAPVKRETLQDKINLVASLRAENAITVRSELDARVTYIGFQEGQPVEEGQILIRLDETALKARLQEAQARLNLAETDFQRAGALLERNTISRQEYDQALAAVEAARAAYDVAAEALDDAVIKAPFAGIMGARRVSLGQFVDRGESLTSLVRIDPLEVEFRVPERHFARIHGGQVIEFTTVAYPDESFQGEVFFIAPEVDAASRTVQVKARVDNTDRRLRPGMYGQLQLVFTVRDDALTIPEAAISFMGASTSVVVMDQNDRAEFRPVTLGMRSGGTAEVREGLREGERVVVEGFQKVGLGMLLGVSPDSSRYGLGAPSGETTTAADTTVARSDS